MSGVAVTSESALSGTSGREFCLAVSFFPALAVSSMTIVGNGLDGALLSMMSSSNECEASKEPRS